MENPDHRKLYNVSQRISIDLLYSTFIKSNVLKSVKIGGNSIHGLKLQYKSGIIQSEYLVGYVTGTRWCIDNLHGGINTDYDLVRCIK